MEKITRSYLIVDREDFSQKIISRITAGKEMLSRKVMAQEALETLKNDISKWSDYNTELLKQSFNNPDNEYLIQYKHSYRPFNFFGSHSLQIDADEQKKKISKYILYLEKIINKADLIPTKGTA